MRSSPLTGFWVHSNRKLATGTVLCSSYLDVCVFCDRNGVAVQQWTLLFLCLVPWPLPSVCYFCLFGPCYSRLYTLISVRPCSKSCFLECVCVCVLEAIPSTICFKISHYPKSVLLFQTSPSNKHLYFCSILFFYVSKLCFSFGVGDFIAQISCVLCFSWKSLDACLLITPLNPPLSQ